MRIPLRFAPPVDNNQPSADFVAQLKENQPLAWREAYAALYPIAWQGAGHAKWRLADEDREEVAVDALSEVARQIGTLNEWNEVTALTFVIARRRSISKLRTLLAQKRGSQATVNLTTEELDVVEHAAETVRDFSQWHDVAHLLEQLIAELGEPTAAILREYLNGASHQEIANRHGKPIGTVGVVISRSIGQIERKIRSSPKMMKELFLHLRLLLLV